MLTRAITGTLFVVAITTAIYYGVYSSALLFILIVLLGVDEFYDMVKKNKHIEPLRIWGTITGLTFICTLLAIISKGITVRYILIPIMMVFFTFILELYRKKQTPFLNIGYTIIGICYIVIPFSMLYHLGYYNDSSSEQGFSYQIILGFFFLLWTNDTGAYLAGKYLGKHKLFERISPKKTWEGSIGGAILTLAVAYVLSIYFTNLSINNWLVTGILITVFGGLGDLVESMLKRSIGIKDSGNILPGHGGILDRFDGLLLAAPFVYCYLQLIQ